jgi:hypothetical protein
MSIYQDYVEKVEKEAEELLEKTREDYKKILINALENIFRDFMETGKIDFSKTEEEIMIITRRYMLIVSKYYQAIKFNDKVYDENMRLLTVETAYVEKNIVEEIYRILTELMTDLEYYIGDEHEFFIEAMKKIFSIKEEEKEK